MKGRTFLELGRVSNLPTVWTNVLAGAALAGGAPDGKRTAALVVACSLFYTGGMFLNDAFDREFDAINRPERPIPSGRALAAEVFAAGFGMMAAALMMLVLLRGSNWKAPVCGLLLASVIVCYDAYHKRNPFSPALMGLCRALIYGLCAFAVSGGLGAPTMIGGLVLFLYVIGLTAVAKNEKFFGNRRWLVPGLIAGISLLDALIIAERGGPAPYVFFALMGFSLTLFLQRYVKGT